MHNKNRPKRLRPKLYLGSNGGKAETTRKLRELLILYVYTSLFWNIGTVQKCCYMAKNNCQNIYIKKKHSWQLSMTCSCVHGFQQVQQIHYTDLQFQHPLSFENIGPIIFRHFNWFTLCLWEEQDCNRNKQNVKHFSWFVCSRFLSYCNGFRLKGTTIPI